MNTYEMCQQHQNQGHDGPPAASPQANTNNRPHQNDPFPWHLGAFDAHCHPTDTMSSIASLATLNARVLAIMATRSQDQHLVAQVAAEHGVSDSDSPLNYEDGSRSDSSSRERTCKVVPAFGWHPWFSYQLYDDTASNSNSENNPEDASTTEDAFKIAHYKAVLSPTPKDPSFLSHLPPPTPLSSFIASTRKHLTSFPYALVGEIGLDKGFRLPQQWLPDDASSRDEGLTPGGREGRLLSPYRVQMQHQQIVLQAQLRLAGEMGRAVSVHGVQAHGVLYDTIAACWKGHERKILSRREKKRIAPGAEESSSSDDDDDNENENGKEPQQKKKTARGKPFPPRICLHSYSGSADTLKQWFHPAVPSQIFVSFSTAVNLGTDGGRAKLEAVVRAVPDDRVLVESDLHMTGEEAEAMLEDIYQLVCEIKGWDLEGGVRTIGKNFQEFIYG